MQCKICGNRNSSCFCPRLHVHVKEIKEPKVKKVKAHTCHNSMLQTDNGTCEHCGQTLPSVRNTNA